MVLDDKNRWWPQGRKPLKWAEGMVAWGKVQRLALSGSFLTKFVFSAPELRSWLATYLVEKPEEALQLIADAQADAIRQLAAAKKHES